MVERLYGVEHGRPLTFAGVNIPGSEYPVAPEAIQDMIHYTGN